MPKERQGYRENLERIHAMFPNKEMLSKTDVMKFCGKSYNWVNKHFHFVGGAISKASLARILS